MPEKLSEMYIKTKFKTNNKSSKTLSSVIEETKHEDSEIKYVGVATEETDSNFVFKDTDDLQVEMTPMDKLKKALSDAIAEQQDKVDNYVLTQTELEEKVNALKKTIEKENDLLKKMKEIYSDIDK